MRMTSFCTSILLLATAAVVPAAHATSDAATATILIARTQVLSQQLANAASEAVGGNVDALANVKGKRDAIAGNMTRLDSYADRLAPKANFARLDLAWAQLSDDAGKVLEGQVLAAGIAMDAGDINAKMPVLNSRMDEVVKILAEKGGPARQIMIASRQMLLADRIQRRIQTILNGGEEAESAASGLQRDAQFYGAVLAALIKGGADFDIKAVTNPNALAILNDINTQWIELAPTVNKLLAAAPRLQAMKQAADNAAIDAQTLLIKADGLMSRINE